MHKHNGYKNKEQRWRKCFCLHITCQLPKNIHAKNGGSAMRNSLTTHLAWMCLCVLLPGIVQAVPKDLPYPTTPHLSAADIITQVYFVNHFYAFKNYGIRSQGDLVTVVIKRQADGSITTNTVERYLNNDYHDGIIQARDLAIFQSGKLRGTALLITDYVDNNKSQSYAIWVPTVRRIRRFAEPSHDDAWSGSDFTFGDVYLRKPQHESHELLGIEIFPDCLGVMHITETQRNQYMQALPQASCLPRGREVYKVKSTTHFKNSWYDYRISYIDTHSFADYRTDYYKNADKIKFIDRDWHAAKGYENKDPRALSWGYWYGKNLQNGHESWAVIPPEVVKFDDATLSPDLWTEQTLSKIRR
jgi:hypothetical protein